MAVATYDGGYLETRGRGPLPAQPRHPPHCRDGIPLDPQSPRSSCSPRTSARGCCTSGTRRRVAFPRVRADELIAAQAAARPAEVAVEFEGRQLTYAELDARANALAHVLQELGVGPDVLVGDLRRALAGDARRRCSGSCAPAAPTFRSTPRFPARSPALHARGRGRPRDRHAGAAALAAVRASTVPVVCLDRDADWIAGRPTTPPPCARDAGRPRLRHLHVRLDGQAEGRPDPAPRARELPDDDGASGRA